MNMQLIGGLICLAIFIAVLASKLPNWMTFVCMAPVAVFLGIADNALIWGTLNKSSIHLLANICIFSAMIAATGLDVVIGNFVDKMTSKATGKSKELAIFGIVYVISGLISFVLQNSYVAMAFLPVLTSIAKVNNISLSKLVLFVIYSTTLGGACTLIGTPTNVYANTALQEAGLAEFGMFDFAWVGIPIFIVGGLYMVFMHRWCPSYDDYGENLPGSDPNKAVNAEQSAAQKKVLIGFLVFILALVNGSLKWVSIPADPTLIGYAVIAVLILTKVVDTKVVLKQFDGGFILFAAGINLMISLMTASGLGNQFGNIIINILGGTKNLYVMTAVLFIGAAIMTSFMNNMACAGILAPVGIAIAEALGAHPQAIVLAIAIGAGCSYLTPIASGTNQTLLPFTKLQFQDFAKFGWPLVIISFVICVAVLPLVFPFF